MFCLFLSVTHEGFTIMVVVNEGLEKAVEPGPQTNGLISPQKQCLQALSPWDLAFDQSATCTNPERVEAAPLISDGLATFELC